MTLRFTLSIACALALLPSQAVRAEQQDDAWLDLSLEELLNVEVTTASWTQSSLRRATASVTVFERRDLERMGFRHLHEVLNFVPGAYSSRVATTGLENRTVLRGNPGTAGGGLLVIDGQRANTMQSVRAWGVLRHFPLSLVERVEVIRGPGAARFGGGPSDEVVHVITRRGENAVQARVSAEGGFGLQGLLALDEGEWRLDLRAATSSEKSPEYTGLFDRFGRVNRSVERSDSDTAILDLGWRNHTMQVLHHASDISGYYGLNGSINAEDDSLLDATWWRYSGGGEVAGWRVDGFASLMRQRFIQGGALAPGGRPPFGAVDVRQRGVFTHRATGGGLTLQRGFGPHTLTFGGEVQGGRNTRADLQANYLLRPPFTYLGDFQSTGLRFSAAGAEDRMTAFYFEDDWQLAPEHRLVLGARRDRYDQSGSATSPRLGWVWTPGERTALKLLYQEAFFAPTLGQLFLQNNPVIAGNPDLQPTRVRTSELIVQQQWNRLLVRGTVYHREAEDGFIVVPGSTTTATTINAASQSTDGFEALFEWIPAAAWRVSLTGSTIFRDRYQLPPTIAQVPPGDFVSKRTASALVHWAPGALEYTLGAHWRSREPLQPRENDPRVMAQLNWRPRSALRVWLHVDNLFNASGADIDVAGGLGINAAGQIERLLPLPTREVGLGVELSWR